MGSENKLKGALVMSKDDFWDLIAQAKEACGQDEDEFVQWIKEQLVELGPHYAQDFHDILHTYSDLSYKYGLWSAATMMGQSSDDKFIDFRSWLIAQGRETYFKVLKDLDSLADIEPGDGSWFESFTHVGDTAMREINGGSAYKGSYQLDHSTLAEELKEDIQYSEGINYPFEGDELPEYFPKLSQQSLTVRVFPICNSKTKLKATANVNIAGAFAVQGFRIFDSKKGLFVKEPEQSYVKDGTELTRPVFFPITKEARDVLYGQILRSYELTMEKEMGQRTDDPGYLPGDGDAPPERQFGLPPEEYVLPEMQEIDPEEDLPFDFGPSM